MTRDPRHDILFEEIQIGPKRMRNRFYQSPHCTSFGTILPGAQAHHRAVKAEGGWGAVNTEFCSVHPSSDARPYIAATLWDEDDTRLLAHMVDMAHDHGALAGVELWHGGSGVGNLEWRLPPGGVSQGTDENYYAVSCHELDVSGIREIQQQYVEAALRARTAGFDIVNVHGAEAGAITQHFLMSKFNRRTDQYGGSLENRARFWIETLEQVRTAVGDSCAITARLCIDTLNDNPLGIRASEEACGFIELADDLVDFWDLQAGGWTAAEWAGDDAVASRFGPEFSHREYYEAVRSATGKPIAAVGRFTNPDTMADVVRSGLIDIIAAARPSIADPFLPKKIEEGRYDEIRECIGCNICASRFAQSSPIICTQNPTVGEEYRRGWHPERFTEAQNSDRSVLVVGAGPAGMECAIVLGNRGMSAVHLVDKNDSLGGSARLIAAYPNLGEWSRLVNYREIQLAKLSNVQVILNQHLSADDVLTYGADIVVIATGSLWRGDGMNGPTQASIPGAQSAATYDPHEVAEAHGAIKGHRVVVYDTDGYFTAIAMAELLIAQGKEVVIVTPFPNLSPYLLLTGEGFRVNRELRQRGVTVATGQVAVEFADGVFHSQEVWSSAHVTWEADAFVLVTQREPCDALYHELQGDPERLEREGIQAVYRVGDCVAPGILADAIFSGHRLAREIDSDNPAIPLPYQRELPRFPIQISDRGRAAVSNQ
jgi:dimethylamine/trimethylamine dehydrogenase